MHRAILPHVSFFLQLLEERIIRMHGHRKHNVACKASASLFVSTLFLETGKTIHPILLVQECLTCVLWYVIKLSQACILLVIRCLLGFWLRCRASLMRSPNDSFLRATYRSEFWWGLWLRILKSKTKIFLALQSVLRRFAESWKCAAIRCFYRGFYSGSGFALDIQTKIIIKIQNY